MSEVDAVIGNWYQLPGGQLFEVVALDERDGCIEIQNYEGDVDELEAEVWDEMPLVVAAPPDDSTGAYEDPEEDDIGIGETFIAENGFAASVDFS